MSRGLLTPGRAFGPGMRVPRAMAFAAADHASTARQEAKGRTGSPAWPREMVV